MPGVTHCTDAKIAALLGQLPQFAHWRGEPLSEEPMRRVDDPDREALMTLAAEALHRVVEAWV